MQNLFLQQQKNNNIIITNGNLAFNNCNNLEYTPIFNGNNNSISCDTMFGGCNKIKSISFKNIVISQYYSLFGNCYALEKIKTSNALLNSSASDISLCYSRTRKLKKRMPEVFNSNIQLMNAYIQEAVELEDTIIDTRAVTKLKRIGCMGNNSATFIAGLKGLRVSNEAPFDSTSVPQINVSYTGMDRDAIVTLFNDLPTVNAGQIINITACTGSSSLTSEDVDIAANKGWTIVGGINPAIVSGATSISLPNAVADSLTYVKLEGGCEQHNIPTGYTQVDGVTNADSGYVDTSIVADVDDMEFDIVATINTSTNISWYLLQSRSNSGAPIYGISGSTSSNTIIGAFSGTSIGTTSIFRQSGHTYHVNFVCKNGTGTLTVEDLTDGTSETKTGTYTFTAATTNIGLFSNILGSGTILDGNTSVLSAYIKKSGVKVMDYVACTDSNSTAGFYDKATSSFKSATAGSFVADTATVPSPLTPIDIVCNNGVVKVSPNLVDFNEIRINGTTWASANKTKGFEVEAAVYAKTIGASAIGNPNCFGVFVPCKLGKSVSINFFDYTVYGARAYYCEVDADGKLTTEPVQYSTMHNVLTQQTFTITQPDSIGFVIEWYITSTQERNYTAENYMVVSGTTIPTSYMPYGQIYVDGTTETVTDSLSHTATAQNLLKVGDYSDIQEVLSGNVTRKVGIKVFDGTENWSLANAENSVYTTYIADALGQSSWSTLGGFCSHLAWYVSSATPSYPAVGQNTLWFNSLRDLRVKTNSTFATTTDWTNYLKDQYAAGTPVIIVYPLATATTETVTGQTMQVQSGSNTIAITQASISGLNLEAKYYKEN